MRTAARAGLTAERVVEAAADLADEAGFDHLTVSALARRLAVKDASLYSHFRNLSDFRTRIALLATGELADRVTAAVAGRAGKDALKASRAPTAPSPSNAPDAMRRPGSRSTPRSPTGPPPTGTPSRPPTRCCTRTGSPSRT